MLAEKGVHFYDMEFYPRGEMCPICNFIFYDAWSMKAHVLLLHIPKGVKRNAIPDLNEETGYCFNKSKIEQISNTDSPKFGIQYSRELSFRGQGIYNENVEEKLKINISNREAEPNQYKYELFSKENKMRNDNIVESEKLENVIDVWQPHEDWKYSRKIHVCEYCGLLYKLKHNLVSHKKLKHMGFRYQCTMCKKTFVTKSGASTHVKRNHDWGYIPKVQMRLVRTNE
jgi:hypothetical protein